MTFLRAAEKCLCVSGPEGGLAFIIELISSESFVASLNSRVHESEDDAIAVGTLATQITTFLVKNSRQ